MISAQLRSAVEQKLSEVFNKGTSILKENSIGGGCINSAHKIETNSGNYFLKSNDADAYPGMFEAEAKGLKLLHKTHAISIPSVIATGESNNLSFIILELFESGKRVKSFW